MSPLIVLDDDLAGQLLAEPRDTRIIGGFAVVDVFCTQLASAISTENVEAAFVAGIVDRGHHALQALWVDRRHHR